MEVRYVNEPAIAMTWSEVDQVCRDMALEAGSKLGPEVVVGVAKGGLIPAAFIASLLQVDLYPCSVTRKLRGQIVFGSPRMVMPVSEKVKGRRVLIVDDMVLTGETMRMVVVQCKKEKARVVKTASLWAQTESWKPTWYGMETAGHIWFPWDSEVLIGGKYVLNPSYEGYVDSIERVPSWGKQREN